MFWVTDLEESIGASGHWGGAVGTLQPNWLLVHVYVIVTEVPHSGLLVAFDLLKMSAISRKANANALPRAEPEAH